MDGRTDEQGDFYIPPPPNFVWGGYNKRVLHWDLYSKLSLQRIPVYSEFGFDMFHCIIITCMCKKCFAAINNVYLCTISCVSVLSIRFSLTLDYSGYL